jgi:hypothetical protein
VHCWERRHGGLGGEGVVSLSKGVRKRLREDEEGYTDRRVRSRQRSGLPKKNTSLDISKRRI